MTNSGGHTIDKTLTNFVLNENTLIMSVQQQTVGILLVGPDRAPFFRCNDAAQALGYSNYYKAVAKHVRPRQIRTLADLLAAKIPILGAPSQPDQNESGLYRLIG